MPRIITFITLILLLSGVAALAAEERPGFEKISVSRAPQDIIIELKALMPVESEVVTKTDTYVPAGKYPYTINISVIRNESYKQLTKWQQDINKWLEESK